MTHMWVELKYTPVDVELKSDGSIDVHTTDIAQEIAHDDAQYGCWICFAPLDRENLNTSCPSEHHGDRADASGVVNGAQPTEGPGGEDEGTG